MKRILVPVDGSDHAVRAAAFAGDLAQKYDADVILLHVIDRSRQESEEAEHMAEVEHIIRRGHDQLPWVANVPAELVAMLGPDIGEAERERALGFLADRVVGLASEVVREHGVAEDRIRVLFKNGHPVKRILETIDEEGADLVVTGSRGLSDLRGVLQGSVSHRVAHYAPCNVVTVR